MAGIALFLFVVGSIGNSGQGNHNKPTPTSAVPTSAAAAKPTSAAAPATPPRNLPPQSDGVYPVKNFASGLTNPGLGVGGWIETDGPRPGSNHCNWARLSTPTMTILGTIQMGQWHGAGPVLAFVDTRDTAFSTYGCAPWRNIPDYDPNAPLPQDALHSPMANTDMPPGSTMAYNDEIKRTNSEIWNTNLSQADMVSWLRQRMSVGSTNNIGMPWACDSSDPKGVYTEWVWQDIVRYFRVQINDNIVEFQLNGGDWPC